MERPVSGIAKAIRRSAARAAAHRGKASPPHGSRRFDERREREGRKAGMALPRLLSARMGDGSRRGFARARVEQRLARAGGRGRRSARRSEVSRVDHVTVDNAVLDVPKRSFHVRWNALEKPKLDSRRQPRSTWYQARPLSSRGQRVPSQEGDGSRSTVTTSRKARRGWQRGRSGSARLRARATGPLADAPLRGRVRVCDPPGAEHPAGARFRESVAGFEETHRVASSGVSGRAVLRGNAGPS
jgi:hypothetical protein